MGLPDPLLHGIYSYGFETPSPIQQRAIMPIKQGRDVLAQAQSGTGKTGAFAIGTLSRINPALPQVQLLILSPTHELAEQTYTVVVNISSRMAINPPLLCMGGTPIADDIARLRSRTTRPQVIVGTPGRVMGLVKSGELDMTHLTSFVLDEADEMLSRGFADQLDLIMDKLPTHTGVQKVVVSATFPPGAVRIATRFMTDPVTIRVEEQQLNLDGISQFYVALGKEGVDSKLDTLLDITSAIPIAKMIIFVNTRRTAEWLTERLASEHFSVATIHADLPPQERRDIMQRFRNDQARVLVGTDALARGIDVQQVSLVINYEMLEVRDGAPKETYVHRIGRCGRHGRKGVVINLIGEREEEDLDAIARAYGYGVKELPSDFPKFFR